MNLKTITDLIEAAGVARAGKDLFAYHMPDEKFQGIIVIPEIDGFIRDPYLTGIAKGMFRVVIRGTKGYPHLFDTAKKVIRALHVTNQTAGVYQIHSIRAIHDPVPFPIPDSDIVECLVTFNAMYTDSSESDLR